jgi:hypothetical protein
MFCVLKETGGRLTRWVERLLRATRRRVNRRAASPVTASKIGRKQQANLLFMGRDCEHFHLIVAARLRGHPIPYFFAQPSPASVSPFGRYSQPIHPS